MPRGRRVSDQEILDAAAASLAARGPAAFTLRDVAARVGLSAPTLVQRFGTKRGLLVALAEDAALGVDHWFDGARLRHPRPLDALVGALAGSAERLGRDEGAHSHLVFLQLDLSDRDLARHTRAFFDAVRDNVERLLEEAVAAGALEEVDTPAFARAVEALYHGTLLTWTVDPKGRVAEGLRRSLGLLLGPRA